MYGLSRSGGAVTPVRLILVGVAVSAMFQAFTNYLVYTAPDDAAVREATFWMLGGLGSAKWEDLPLLALILPPLFLVLMALARPLNAMLMGDSSAVTLGVDLDRVRGVLILVLRPAHCLRCGGERLHRLRGAGHPPSGPVCGGGGTTAA